MSLDSTTEVDGRVTRARRGFRAWRKGRPFWGGLLMMASGVFLYLGSNLQPGNLTVHVGLSGFLSYLLPLMMILTGALVWASPSQRVFYGVIGMVTAIYSLIGNNLGGFLIGLLLGMFGSGLAAAWVPDKRLPTDADGDDGTVVDEQMGILDPDTRDLGEPTAGIPDPRAGDDDDHPGGAGSPRHATTESEGEQRERFRGRHAAGDGTAQFGLTTAGRGPKTRPAVVSLKPRLAAVVAFTIAAGTVAAVNLQSAVPARADTTSCTTDQFKKTITQGTHGDGVGDILGGFLGHLGLAPNATDSPTDNPTPTPSDTPTNPPTDPPTPTPTPSDTPTEAPTPTPTPTPTKPKPTPTDTPTQAPTPDPTNTGQPNPPTPTPTPCPTSAPKTLKAAADQAVVSSNPSILTTDLLTISGLSFDGIVDLPTAGGTITVLKFSMSSTTQTPFNLVSDPGAKILTTTADTLTVSGNVSFYTTELKGNLLGLVAVDYTPSNPPPLVIPDLFFTGVMIKLVDVIGDQLTADNMAQIKS